MSSFLRWAVCIYLSRPPLILDAFPGFWQPPHNDPVYWGHLLLVNASGYLLFRVSQTQTHPYSPHLVYGKHDLQLWRSRPCSKCPPFLFVKIALVSFLPPDPSNMRQAQDTAFLKVTRSSPIHSSHMARGFGAGVEREASMWCSHRDNPFSTVSQFSSLFSYIWDTNELRIMELFLNILLTNFT